MIEASEIANESNLKAFKEVSELVQKEQLMNLQKSSETDRTFIEIKNQMN